MDALKVACVILVAFAICASVKAYTVIQIGGCDKVVRQEPTSALAEKGAVYGLGFEVCAEVCSFWSCTKYYCPGNTICCQPGSPTSKCCPADHPLCLPEGCCPEGYPKICGKYCCKSNSFCCDEKNCCKNEESCCGEDQCCLEEAPCCKENDKKTCCSKDNMACCDGYGCVEPCDWCLFDAYGCGDGPTPSLNLTKNEDERFAIALAFRFLYRVLRRNENYLKIVAKNPYAKKTVISHVNCGSRDYYRSQLISFTASIDMAKAWRQMAHAKFDDNFQIARIDLQSMPESFQIYDLTKKSNRDKWLGNSERIKNFAKKYDEVLVECPKPIKGELIEDTEDNIRDFSEL